MEKLSGTEFKEELEALKNSPDYPKYSAQIKALEESDDPLEEGDAIFLHHEDKLARTLWAFHRHPGTTIEQLQDPEPAVAIVGFNRSKLTPLKRFTSVNQEVLHNESYRMRIRNRARMLFRSLVDNDFTELMEVLQRYPFYLELACDQVIHGRRMLEIPVDIKAGSTFLQLAEPYLDEQLLDAFTQRLAVIDDYTSSEVAALCKSLHSPETSPYIVQHFNSQITCWLGHSNLHELQKKVIENLLPQYCS